VLFFIPDKKEIDASRVGVLADPLWKENVSITNL
jgi:hypothetical protein